MGLCLGQEILHSPFFGGLLALLDVLPGLLELADDLVGSQVLGEGSWNPQLGHQSADLFGSHVWATAFLKDSLPELSGFAKGVHLAGEGNSSCSLLPYQSGSLLSQLASDHGEMLVEGVGQVPVPFLDCFSEFLDLVWDSFLHTEFP